MTPRHRIRRLQWGLLTIGILALGLWSWTEVVARSFQASESARLDEPRSAAALQLAVVVARPGTGRRAAAPGAGADVLGRLEIPRLKIAAVVAEGVDNRTLARAIGHIPVTARPGAPGNCALAGHRDTFLRGLGAVRVNDVVRIVTPERTYLYQVEWFAVVEPGRVDVLDSTATRSVTLITCYPFVYVGHAPRRFVVRARQVESVEALAEAGAGRDAD